MHSKRVKLICLALVALAAFGLAGCTGTGAVPRGWSGAAVGQNDIYIANMDGKLAAINLSTRNREWSDYKFTPPPAGGFNFGCSTASGSIAIYGTPALGKDLAYVGGYDGKVYAIAAATGQLRWVYPRQDYIGPIIGAIAQSGGRLFFGTSKGIVYALDADTGDLVWQYQTDDKIWATPQVDASTVYVGSFDRNLYALNAADGKLKWKAPVDGAIVAMPALNNGVLYFGAFDRYVYAINAADGSRKWRSPMAANWFWADALVYGDNVYAANLDGNLYVCKAGDGSLAATVSMGNPVNSSPVLVGSAVVVANKAGQVYSVDTATNQKRLLAELNEIVNSPLAAGSGVVYVHSSSDTLWAIDAQSGTKLWNLALKS